MKTLNCAVVNMKSRRLNSVEEKGLFEKVLIIRENLLGDEDLAHPFRIVLGKKKVVTYMNSSCSMQHTVKVQK